MRELIKNIVALEWEMFHNVNGEARTECQNEQATFELMRNAQFDTWNDETLASYLEDLKAAVANGKSLIREKYIHMMKNTDKDGYEAFKQELPEITEAKQKLVDDIWTLLLAQTEKFREKYPLLALGGRPLHASEEQDWPSVETYQKGELLTYSENTLKLLLDHIKKLDAEGVSIAYKIQENSVTCLGYKTMDEAEFAMANQFMQEMGIEIGPSECPSCKIDAEI